MDAHRTTGTDLAGSRPAEPAAGPGRSRGRLRWLLVAAALALVVVVVAVVRWTGDDPQPPVSAPPPPDAESPAPLTRADWQGTGVGVFRKTDPEAVQGYEEWLGRRVELAVDFSSREDWRDISRPQYQFDAWEGLPYRLVLGIAMLPDEVDASLEAGARGEYDEYFQTLAEGLVDAGQEDAILRIGWEFNLPSWVWSSEDEDTWVAYWRRIVDVMRSVDGEQFRFDWNVNNGPSRIDAVDYYPGDEYVDYVGVDAYDVTGAVYPIPDDCDQACADALRREAWRDEIYGGERGLRFWSEFAAQHDKQLSLPEWGVWERNDGIGGGDNPYYIEQMAEFIADPENRVGYQAYFENANSQGTHELLGDDFPRARERYLELFGGPEAG
ncbi:glycoside hydrolase family 26 protein [Modestobacter roseus]|uniref:glycoside hydrolase family 26 protein n=1 Tax=Modestobacter roseus TaxID=1181884 RepID=UPI0034DE19D6